MSNYNEKNKSLQLEEGVHDEDHENGDNNCQRSENNDHYQSRLPMRMMNNKKKKKEKVAGRPEKYRSLKQILHPQKYRSLKQIPHPQKYRSLKQILRRLDHHSNEGISRPPPPPPPPPPSLSHSTSSDQYPNGDGDDDDDDDDDGVCLSEETVESSELVNLARFSFKWGKTDIRGRESRLFLTRFSFKWGKTDMRGRQSRIADQPHEFSGEKAVVHQAVVGYKCGESLKELLYGMYERAGVKVITRETATTSMEASTSAGGKRKVAKEYKNNDDDITGAINPKMKKPKEMMN